MIIDILFPEKKSSKINIVFFFWQILYFCILNFFNYLSYIIIFSSSLKDGKSYNQVICNLAFDSVFFLSEKDYIESKEELKLLIEDSF